MHFNKYKIYKHIKIISKYTTIIISINLLNKYGFTKSKYFDEDIANEINKYYQRDLRDNLKKYPLTTICIMTPINAFIEEVLFRYLFFSILFKNKYINLLQAFCFSLCHDSGITNCVTNDKNKNNLIVYHINHHILLFTVGFIFGHIMLKYNKLWIPSLIHTLHNQIILSIWKYNENKIS